MRWLLVREDDGEDVGERDGECTTDDVVEARVEDGEDEGWTTTDEVAELDQELPPIPPGPPPPGIPPPPGRSARTALARRAVIK